MPLLDRLRQRLGKSSVGIESGLDAIVAARVAEDEGGTSQPNTVSMMSAATSKTSSGLLGRMATGLGKIGLPLRRRLDDTMREEIEELLLTADMGVSTSRALVDGLAKRRLDRDVTATEVRQFLAEDLAERLSRVERPIVIDTRNPCVLLVVGVNGSGKTTTIGKLADRFQKAGHTVMIAAADTFRAAAIEQLEIWAARVGVPVITGSRGADPASVAYSGLREAQQVGADILLVDTAGRMQNRNDLMHELAKIIRVLKKLDADAPHQTLLVLDATTGQNALNQVKVFGDMAEVSGLIMTKLDGTARGGILVAIADRFDLPIHAIGIGEGADDLTDFVARDFAMALAGVEDDS